MADVVLSMAKDIAERKADRRRNLEADHDEKLRVVMEEVRRVQGEEEKSALEARRTQLKSLAQLVQSKTDVERQITAAVAELTERFEQMKQELRAAVSGKMEDVKQAQEILTEQLKVDENGVKQGDDGEEGGDGKGQSGGQHAGGDKATEDGKGIIRDVPGKDQVKRAEDMARVGRRV